MAERYSRQVSKVVVGQLAETAGFHAVHESAVDVLADLMLRYIAQLGSASHSYAELAGRTDCNINDLLLTFEDMGVDLDQLKIAFMIDCQHLMSCEPHLLLSLTVPAEGLVGVKHACSLEQFCCKYLAVQLHYCLHLCMPVQCILCANGCTCQHTVDLDRACRFDLLQKAGLKPDRVTYNTLLKCCMRNCLPDKALDLHKQMSQFGIPADEHTYTTLIKTLSYSGRVDDALKVRHSMVAAEFEPTDTVWGSLMVACGQAGQLESALTLWGSFKQARGGLQTVKNPEPCMALLIACAHTYQLRPALNVLAEMRQAGVPVTTQVYNCVMAACSVPPTQTLPVENLDAAFGLLEDMAAQGVETDTATYATLMNLCAEARQGQRALHLMQELQAKRVKLNTVVYTAFIKACGTSPGLVDAAHAAFKKMIWGPRRMKPNQVTFITTMRVLREASRLHQALDVYMGMRRAGFPGVNSEFQELVKACAEAALETNDSELQTKVGNFLLQYKREGQKESVDLHSLSAKEARAAVLCVLCNIQERFKGGQAIPSELAIIVGRGQHVQHGGPKLREAVEELLQHHLHMNLHQVGKADAKTEMSGPTSKARTVSNAVQPEPATASTPRTKMGCDAEMSSSDDAADVTAQLADALKGSNTWQQKRHSKNSQHAKQPNLAVSGLPAQAGNEGRIVVSQDALLHWLHSKAS